MKTLFFASKSAKKWFSAFGFAFSVLGIVFVVIRFLKYSSQVELSWLVFNKGFPLVVFSIVYGVANLFLASAWYDLLLYFGIRADFCWAVRVYAFTQLAKYVPGNIFHLAGRQAMGTSAGFPFWSLAKSVIFEILLIAGAGIFFVLLILPFFLATISNLQAVGLFLISVLVSFCFVHRFLGLLLAKALLKYVVFLGLSGVIFVSIIFTAVSLDFAILDSLKILGFFVFAWLVGFVTPGAPAGVGIRELVLLKFLGSVVGEANLIAAVVLGRIVTVIGDVIFYVFVMGFGRKHQKRPTS